LWPYQKEIANAIGDPEYERVTVIKSVRIGYTTLLTGALANYVSNDPAPILCLLPTESDCRDYVVSDVEPIFGATPVLSNLLAVEGNRKGDRSTILARRFPGGFAKFVAAKSPRNLRRHTVRLLFVDETDAMQPGAEGNPLALAEKRTLSYPDRKIIMGSTPTDEDTSQILRAYAQSDQRVFEVPCPSCGAYTEILWSHIEWEPDRPETAAFRCPHCSVLITERDKLQMAAAGRWRATAPHVVGHAGFRINALISPLANASWAKLVEEFLRARNDTDNLRTFVNCILAQGWRDAADEIDELIFRDTATRFPAGTVPPEVLSITAGCDLQDDRCEISYIGWGRDETAYVLSHDVLWGSPDDAAFWIDLDTALRTTWRHPWGGELRVDAAIVDSGNWTDKVYAFCFPRASRRIMAGKGIAGAQPSFKVSKGKVRGGRLFLVGVDTIKTTIMNRLLRGQSLQFAHDLDDEYFRQLCSERRVVRYSRGQPVVRFERRSGFRAETLDCMVYAFCAHYGAHVQLDQRESDLRQKPRPVAQQREEKNWIGETRTDWI